MKVLVTGGAGSIGAHVVRALLQRGDQVAVVDNFNDFYDPALKRARLAALTRALPEYSVQEADVTDAAALGTVFQRVQPDAVVHLAAWAAVHPSVRLAALYTRNNVEGTVNVFECCVAFQVRNVVFASSSSVYPRAALPPLREDLACDMPLAPYGASKRAGELYARMYHYLHHLPIVCLRFFTVYGPWIRPDMAVWSFAERMLQRRPIELYRFGEDGTEVRRDFTYIDDVVSGVLSALDRNTTFDIINLGGSDPVPLTRLVRALEAALGREAVIEERVLPPEAALTTGADISKARALLGYAPTVSVEEGVRRFVDWYRGEFLEAFPQGLAPSRYVR